MPIISMTLDELKAKMRGNRLANMTPSDMIRNAQSLRRRMRERYAINGGDSAKPMYREYIRAMDAYITMIRAYRALTGELFPWEQ